MQFLMAYILMALIMLMMNTLGLFLPGYSQYLTFSFDGGRLGGPGDKGQYPLRSIDFQRISSFTQSMSYRS